MASESGNSSGTPPGNETTAHPEGKDTITAAGLAEVMHQFSVAFQASAKRWELIVYPFLFGFIVLAAYGFYLIYSMVSDVHRVTQQMDPIVNSMVMVSDSMVRVTDNMSSMTTNIASITASMRTMTNEVVHMTNKFDEAVAIAAHMNHSVATMVPIASRMQHDADAMTHRMYKVTKPMNFMSNMFPMGSN
jgi:hypothetical protein